MESLSLGEDYLLEPQILAVEKDFLIVYKPPRMHSTPLASSRGKDLSAWCLSRFPELADLPERREGEGGLLHRLDYETQGILLVARSRIGMEFFLEEQRKGKIVKEYSALSAPGGTLLPGFPPKPFALSVFSEGKDCAPLPMPLTIESAFRPYGTGRKAVRPVSAELPPGGNPKRKGRKSESPGERVLYSTEIQSAVPDSGGIVSFNVKIPRGFRHQIRNHLAWLGFPILNDRLYGGLSYGEGFLGLRAVSLFFREPSSGKALAFSVPALKPSSL